MAEGPIGKVNRDKIVKAMLEMQAGKAVGPSEVSTEMIAASGDVGIRVMMELCQRLLDGKGMPEEWKISVVTPIFNGKRGCNELRGI